uniref:hypothetical protein n=1 Tax=Bartonella taylorii TaxID=33046 RepID=UPI001ABAE7C6
LSYDVIVENAVLVFVVVVSSRIDQSLDHECFVQNSATKKGIKRPRHTQKIKNSAFIMPPQSEQQNEPYHQRHRKNR